jgi:hypothetical protein
MALSGRRKLLVDLQNSGPRVHRFDKISPILVPLGLPTIIEKSCPYLGLGFRDFYVFRFIG